MMCRSDRTDGRRSALPRRRSRDRDAHGGLGGPQPLVVSRAGARPYRGRQYREADPCAHHAASPVGPALGPAGPGCQRPPHSRAPYRPPKVEWACCAHRDPAQRTGIGAAATSGPAFGVARVKRTRALGFTASAMIVKRTRRIAPPETPLRQRWMSRPLFPRAGHDHADDHEGRINLAEGHAMTAPASHTRHRAADAARHCGRQHQGQPG